MKLHVIGEPDAVLGLALVGLTGEVAMTPAEVRAALAAATQNPEIGVILVTERAAAQVPTEMDALRIAKSGPLVLEIPGPEGPLSGRPSLRDIVARATGVRI